MALAEICKISNASYMKPTAWNSADATDDLKTFSCNLANPYTLAAPPFENPMHNLNQIQANSGKTGIKIDFDHGTTTLGFKYQGGVILAVDSRATGGQYIGSQTMKKIVEINDFLLGTLAGGAADCVYWDRVLSKECRLHELRNKERISVAAASKIMANIAHEYKGMGLSMGMMLAGYDKRGPGLYYVDSEGSRTPGNLFSVGSGSLFAYGVLDSGYRWDLQDKEAQELGQRAIYHATFRDAYSGGIIRVYHMTPTGWVNVSNTDCMELHYKFKEEKAAQ
ncbi:proteasome subunit beta type-5 [Drosophila guanche]|uniref:Proteasome subunit beta n=1 Tax=Drosophila guanche TaxID=7266 RepID=A0A3B0JL10_DROGU|nr:proteasome subunit beta type-5 [Drosophila guanche]SPP74159.1 blast:Proteasome subunit beta type-5 [Drosophila guanche]